MNYKTGERLTVEKGKVKLTAKPMKKDNTGIKEIIDTAYDFESMEKTNFFQTGKIKHLKGKTTCSEPIGSACDDTIFPMKKTNNLEDFEQEIASNSYRADQHEESEMVIKSSRVLEITGESILNRKKALLKETEERVEKLADLEHKQWSHWMSYMFTKCSEDENGNFIIPKELVNRWGTQTATKYEDLSKKEKDSDREWAIKVLKIIKEYK